MSIPHVAVAMTVYKRDSAEHLVEAINSLLDQSFRDISIYIGVDGPITEEIKLVLDSFEGAYNNVFVVNFKSNRGLAPTLNDLIDKIMEDKTVTYIARMDADDICFPMRIERQVQYMTSRSDVFVSGTFCQEFGADFALEIKKLPEHDECLVKFSVARCPFIHPTVIFRREVFEDGLRYPTNCPYTEDQAFWFDLIEKGYRLGNLSEVLLKYRLNNNTVKRRLGWKKLIQEFRLRFRYMIKLNQLGVKNLVLILARIAFHLSPESVVQFFYRYLR